MGYRQGPVNQILVTLEILSRIINHCSGFLPSVSE